MSRASIARAAAALALAVAVVALALMQAGFPVVAGAIGVRVGSPGAGVELTRAVLPIVVAASLGAFFVRFGIRALRFGATVRGDLAAGGKLLAATGWLAWAWLVFELVYRQLYLGWATLFGNLGRSLSWSAVAVVLAIFMERFVPWSRAPRGLRHLGLFVVAGLAVFTALSAWSHRDVVPGFALVPVALVGLVLLMSGVRRAGAELELHTLVELVLASMLLSGPIWRLLS
jgi:hypothetical protein